MRIGTGAFKGSSLLMFDVKNLSRKLFPPPHASQSNDLGVAGEVLPQSNKLIQSEALYFLEPEDIRKCLEQSSPSSSFCLILSNKSS